MIELLCSVLLRVMEYIQLSSPVLIGRKEGLAAQNYDIPDTFLRVNIMCLPLDR